MSSILELFQQDLQSLILGIFILLSAFIAIADIIGKVSTILGKPVKWVSEKDNDHQLLLQTIEAFNDLKKQHEESVKQSIRHDEMIRHDLDKLTKMMLDKEVDDWRWEILNMASALSRGVGYSKEQFDHVLKIYERYEKVLEENSMTNGQVDVSMEVINEVYKEKLKNGF